VDATGPIVFHDETRPLPRTTAVDADAGAREKDLSASNKAALSDGLALSISGAVGSLAGFASWLIAARIMPQESVGYASAFVSAFLLVAGVAQLNLDSSMMLWMPKSGKRAPTLYWRSHAVIIPACGIVALLYVALIPSIARDGTYAGGPTALGVGLFAVAAIGWGLWGVHDFSLIAVGRPWWAPYRNIAFAIVRIGLLVALGASLGSFGIVLSWVIPIAIWGVFSAGLGGWATRRFARDAQDSWLPQRPEVVKFLGPTTVGHWGTVLLFNQVTVMVTERFGPVPGAAFFIAWQAVMVIDIAAQRFMQSLSAQLARDPEHAEEHVRSSRRRLFVIFTPAILIGIALADFGLQIFGPGYAEASNVLRVLLIGALPRLLIAHELGRRQAAGDGMGFARLQLVSTLLVIGVVVFVPITATLTGGTFPVAALMPVAIGYTVTQALCAAAVVVLEMRRRAGLRRAEVTA
jgi:O-antigen/teichoic acid export membrane protein